MDITVTEDKNNALLNRREINFKVKYEGATPSRNDVRNKLLAMLDASLDLTIIQKLDNEYGMQELTGYVKIYEDAVRMVQIERKHMVKRNEVPAKPEAEVSGDTEDKAAPVVEDEVEVTPITEDETEATPVAEDETDTVPIVENEDEAAPVVEDETEAVPTAEDETVATPVAEDEAVVTPVAEDEDEATPVAEDEAEAAPVVEDEDEAKVEIAEEQV